MKPFGIFLSTDVTRAFLWFLNLCKTIKYWEYLMGITWGNIEKPTSGSSKKQSSSSSCLKDAERALSRPDRAVNLLPYWTCSCLAISQCSPYVSKFPPARCSDLTHSLSCLFTHEEKGYISWMRVSVFPPQAVDGQQDDDNEKQRYDQCWRQHMSTFMGGVLWRGHIKQI